MYKIEESQEREDLSIGENLETFIDTIKNGKMNKETIPDNLDRESVYWDWVDSDENLMLDLSSPFLLYLLNEKERKKLEEREDTFMRTFSFTLFPDVWKASEFNSKFGYYACHRATYFIDPYIINLSHNWRI